MVLTLELLGIRSIVACAGTADTTDGFARWYTRLLRTVVHIDVSGGDFILFHRAMKTIYRLSKEHSAVAVREPVVCISRPTRPTASVFRDRLKRAISIRQTFSPKLSKAGSRPTAISPKVKLSLSQSSTPSSRASRVSSSSPPAYGGFHLDPLPAIAARRDPTTFIPPPPDDGSESPLSNTQHSTAMAGKQGYDPKLKQDLWLLAEEFPDPPTLIKGFHTAKLDRGRITILTIEALMRRCKSPASNRGVIKNVSGLVKFLLDTRGGLKPGIALTGDTSVVLLRDYLQSVAERGRAVPGAVKTSLSTWSETLGVPWPLDNPLVCAAAQVESNEAPKHAPPVKLDTVKKLENMALNVEVTPCKRAFASGALLMTYTCLRFSDVQRLRIHEVNEGSVRGTLLQSKTKKPHGLPWPWACPRMGVSGSTERIARLIDFRNAHEKQNGSMPSFVFPRLDRRWELERAEPAPYSATRRKLALVCTGLNDPDGDTYTLHSPKNFSPTAATQMNFATRELNVIGHWSSNSRMNERYDRSVCE